MSDFEDDRGADSPRSRVWFLGAAGVVALILAMGIFASIAALNGDDEDEVGPDPDSPTTSAPAAAPEPGESICGLPGHEKKGTLSAPPKDVTWTLVGRFAAPESDTAGPGVVEKSSGVRYCYSRTPEGALLAAANTYAWGMGPKSDPVAVLEQGLASGPGYETAVEQARQAPRNVAPPTTPTQIRGFRLLSYSGESAFVDLAFQVGDAGGYTQHQVELVWEKGDWRMVVRPDGSLVGGSALPDLTGYIPWAGA